MALDTVGILTPVEFGGEQPTVLTAVERQIFVNETPLYARLPHLPATSQVYSIVSYDVRGRTYALAADITNSATTLSIADASPFLNGDVLELTDGTNTERVEVMAAPNLTPTPNTLTVRRAREGTTGTAFALATPTVVRLLYNSRTGSEIDQQAHRAVRTSVEQYVQTFQNPVQVGGLANAIQNVSLPPGASSVFGLERAIMLLEILRDIEYAFYYGKGEKPAAVGDRAKTKGLRYLIPTANVRTGAGASYTFLNFVDDGLQKIYDVGGRPDVALCSTSFLSGIYRWAPNKTTFTNTVGTNRLGMPITGITMPMGAQEITFVPSLQLRSGTVALLTSEDLTVRPIRDLFWNQRGNRGDAMEGEWIGDYSLYMGHSSWHVWIDGITSYA